MSHADSPRNRSRSHSVTRHNAHHFLTRERLNDNELDEWIHTAFVAGREEYRDAPQLAVQAFRQEMERVTREVFGEDMSLRSIGGLVLCLDQVVRGVSKAQGITFNRKSLPSVLEDAYKLQAAVRCIDEGLPLSREGLKCLRYGGEILDAVADYAREVALVVPITTRDKTVRDAIRPISHGMPAVDIKFSFMAKEYNEHIAPSIPSWSLTGRVA